VEDVDLDFIGKLESLERDFRVIQDRLLHTAPLPARNVSKSSNPIGGSYIDIPCGELIAVLPRLTQENFYTQEAVCLIAQRYREDIETFGYHDRYPF
jgi:hypothetical protein